MINRRALRARSHRGDLSPKSMKKSGKWGPNTSYRVSFSHGLLIDHRSLSDCHLLDFYFVRKMAADFFFFFTNERPGRYNREQLKSLIFFFTHFLMRCKVPYLSASPKIAVAPELRHGHERVSPKSPQRVCKSAGLFWIISFFFWVRGGGVNLSNFFEYANDRVVGSV